MLQMTRAAGTPIFLYSNENVGLSDTALHASRSSVASASSSATCGKQLDVALHVLDGASGKLDPAFPAHEGPIKYWALAVWEAWFSVHELQIALDQAKKKINGARGSCWAVVSGPVTALVATASRIGWTIASATSALDDLQHKWDSAADSPAAIANAVAHSVRRWRLNKILHALPTATPTANDCAAPLGQLQLFDFACTIKSMATGKGPGKKQKPSGMLHGLLPLLPRLLAGSGRRLGNAKCLNGG